MASAKSSFNRAIAAHRAALGRLAAVQERLERLEVESTHGAQSAARQTRLAERMTALAAQACGGWLGQPWERIQSGHPPTESDALPGAPSLVRIGEARPLPGVAFPVVVPFIGVGHLVIDRDARDPLVSGVLRALLTRLLAAYPAGTLRILAVDGGALGALFAPFRALVAAGVMNDPVNDVDGLRNLLNEAEEQVRRVQAAQEPDPDVLVLTCAGLPPGCGRGELARIAALAHAGPAARVHLLLTGFTSGGPGRDRGAALELATHVTGGQGELFRVSDPPRGAFGAEGRGLNAPVALDPAPSPDLVEELCRHVARRAESEGALTFDDLVPERLWTESSIDGLSTVVGRIGRGDAVLRLDDVTPHWLVGGRTGSGKTVFLMDVLYGLAARYSPDELAMYLLDFKEGVSFTEFTPSPGDPSWVPHARTVGVESDREYGRAVLAELVREMNRRAAAMKQAAATKLSDLRRSRSDLAMPRIVTVIDEFHVLFQGNDETAKRAAALLEEVARKGRSYGIHLILASQSISGIEALYTKGAPVFGQFGQRIALSGGGGVLDPANPAAGALPLGQAILNDAAGVASGNRRARFPDADLPSVARLRHRIWQLRTPGSVPPAVFVGYAEYHLEEDHTFRRLDPRVRRRTAYLGRAVDIGLPTVGFALEATPGRHLAVLGTSAVGADLLHAAAVSLAQQYEPGRATFLLAGLVAAADPVVEETLGAVEAAGQVGEVLGVAAYRDVVGRLAAPARATAGSEEEPTFLVVFGADVASTALRQPYPGTKRSAMDDFRSVLRDGPMRGVHVLGWWRGFRRLTEDLGLHGKEDVAGIVALNIRGTDFGPFLGHYGMEWAPRHNRALFVDRHEDSRRLFVPFVRPGRYASHDAVEA